MNSKEFYIEQKKRGLTDNITANPTPCFDLEFYAEIFSLMESYAKIQAIEFAKWFQKHAYSFNTITQSYYRNDKTTEQLYQKFMEEQSK